MIDPGHGVDVELLTLTSAPDGAAPAVWTLEADGGSGWTLVAESSSTVFTGRARRARSA